MNHCGPAETGAAQERLRGFTLIELLAVVTILGVLAAVAISGLQSPTDQAKRNACYVNKGELELQAQLWYRNTGIWPRADLSDMARDPAYCPSGPPRCPVDGSPYRFDSRTQRIIGHVH